MRSIAALCCLVSGAAAFSCSGSNKTTSGFSNDGGYSGQTLGGDAGPAGSLGSGSGSGPSSPGCSQAATYVYVIDENGGLYSFDPGSLTFKTIGTINCQGAASINSMAVDRSATAWVNDIAGNIYKVSTTDASCQPTSYNAPFGYTQLGMGFSSNSAGGSAETLYVDGIGGSGLATIDLTTMALTPVGNFDGALAGQDCELTGTGNAQLYGFFTTTPASVAEIDKATGHILSNVPQQNVSTGNDWAFSFWGGDFYLYTATQPATTDVTRYRPSDGTTTVVKSQIGFRIVGAGVSTCAPTQPPK